MTIVSVPRLVLGSTYGNFWPKHANFDASTVRKLNTPDFDILHDLGLICDLNFTF